MDGAHVVTRDAAAAQDGDMKHWFSLRPALRL
jgi:hypothetical protein